MKTSLLSLNRRLSSVAAFLLTGLALGHLAVAGTAADEPSSLNATFLSEWWTGDALTGNWFGVRDELEDRGLKFSGKYYGAFFGVVDSQRGSRGFWDQGLEFGAELNFGKIFDVEALEGVKAFGQVRWRDSRAAADPNQFVQASSLFNPSNWISGVQWRLLSFGLEVSSKELLPVKDLIVLRGGWLQPQKEFIDQPLSKLFLNNAVNSAKGVGGNIPFSSSFSTWGATLKVSPQKWYYAKGGLFLAYPSATSGRNHGLAFEGFGPDPNQNGLMAMAETGITPEIGPAKLPGKYAFGTYYFGGEKDSFNGTDHYGQYGFYWQADQMLFREVDSAAPSREAASIGKNFRDSASTEKPKLSKQGLSMFNLVTFAPDYNNLYPFYFQSGLVYQGLIPTRDADLSMVSLAYGNYSYANTLAKRAEGSSNQPDYTIFLEGGYRVQITEWAFIQPFLQYAIRPHGTGSVRNATILGFYTGVAF